MIFPEEVVVKMPEPGWVGKRADELENIVDAVLRPDWIDGETRVVSGYSLFAREEIRDINWDHPVSLELIRRYRKAGWSCSIHGYTSIRFWSPKLAKGKTETKGKRRWWVWG